MLQDLDEPTIDPAIQSQEDKEIYHQNISNDFDDLEEIPLYSRRNNAIVTQRNGKQAYMSKSLHETMLWDLQPPPRRTRAGNRNILRMRVDCVGDEYTVKE